MKFLERESEIVDTTAVNFLLGNVASYQPPNINIHNYGFSICI